MLITCFIEAELLRRHRGLIKSDEIFKLLDTRTNSSKANKNKYKKIKKDNI